MNILENIVKILFVFDKGVQPVGLSQFKNSAADKRNLKPSIRQKDIKLSDLMRRS